MRGHGRAGLRGIVVAAMVCVPLHATATPASAEPLVVDTGGDDEDPDDGVTSLREALASAAWGGTITFAEDVDRIELTAPLYVRKSVTVDGGGRVTIDAMGAPQVFYASSIDLTLALRGLTLTGAISRVGDTPGGAVRAFAIGGLHISDVIFVDNLAEEGGAALDVRHTPILIEDARFVNNSDGGTEPDLFGGGAVFLRGAPGSVVRSIFTSNQAGHGAALSLYGETSIVTVEDSLFHANTATPEAYSTLGGTILLRADASLELVNSTVSGNVGDGIVSWTGFVTLRHATVAHNTLNGVWDRGDSVIGISHSVFSSNGEHGLDSRSSPAIASHNIVEDDDDPWGDATNQFGVDPLLQPLADNRGSTLTHALAEGSPAIDAGEPTEDDWPEHDQRGFVRTVGDAPDLGAYEHDATAPTLTIDGGPRDGDRVWPGTATFPFSAADPNGVTITCSVDGVATTPCTSSLELTDLSTGSHEIGITATDDLGNAAILRRRFTVAPPAPPPPPPADPPLTVGPDAVCDGSGPATFDDVPDDATHAAAIACAVDWQLLAGTTPDTFSPGGLLTRGQFATMLDRLLDAVGAPAPEPITDAFDDDNGSVHEPALDRLAADGLLHGTAPQTSAHQAPVTRGQAATLLVGVWRHVVGAEPPAGTLRFADAATSPHAAAIGAAEELGLVSGHNDGSFGPSQTLRRAQAAGMLVGLLEALAEAGVVPATAR